MFEEHEEVSLWQRGLEKKKKISVFIFVVTNTP